MEEKSIKAGMLAVRTLDHESAEKNDVRENVGDGDGNSWFDEWTCF